MRADKRQVAVVHVCIANERTKGIQQRGTLVGLGVDVPRRCQRLPPAVFSLHPPASKSVYNVDTFQESFYASSHP